MIEEKIKNWLDSQPNSLAEKLKAMDSNEYWVVGEDDDLYRAATDLADILSVVYGGGPLVVTEQEQKMLIDVLAYLRTSLAMHLLYLLSQKQPGIGAGLIAIAYRQVNEPENHLMIARITALFRMQMMDRVFGEDRRETIQRIIAEFSRKEFHES